MGGPVEREVEWSAGAHGLCRASFGETRESLAKQVPASERAGLGVYTHVPFTVGFEPWPPGPGSPEAFPSRAADPAEPPVWLGALWASSGRREQRHQLVRLSRAGGLCDRLPLALRAARLLLQGLYLLQNFPNCGSGSDTREPTAKSPTPFSSAAPCAPGAAAAVETHPRAAPPPPGADSRTGTAPPAGAWAAASRTPLFTNCSYFPASFLSEVDSEQMTTPAFGRVGACIPPGLPWGSRAP